MGGLHSLRLPLPQITPPLAARRRAHNSAQARGSGRAKGVSVNHHHIRQRNQRLNPSLAPAALSGDTLGPRIPGARPPARGELPRLQAPRGQRSASQQGWELLPCSGGRPGWQPPSPLQPAASAPAPRVPAARADPHHAAAELLSRPFPTRGESGVCTHPLAAAARSLETGSAPGSITFSALSLPGEFRRDPSDRGEPAGLWVHPSQERGSLAL